MSGAPKKHFVTFFLPEIKAQFLPTGRKGEGGRPGKGDKCPPIYILWAPYIGVRVWGPSRSGSHRNPFKMWEKEVFLRDTTQLPLSRGAGEEATEAFVLLVGGSGDTYCTVL